MVQAIQWRHQRQLTVAVAQETAAAVALYQANPQTTIRDATTSLTRVGFSMLHNPLFDAAERSGAVGGACDRWWSERFGPVAAEIGHWSCSTSISRTTSRNTTGRCGNCLASTSRG